VLAWSSRAIAATARASAATVSLSATPGGTARIRLSSGLVTGRAVPFQQVTQVIYVNNPNK
jgi:hypothetical protein